MSDRGRKRRVKAMTERGYDQETHLLYLPSQKLEEDDVRFIIDELKEADLRTLKISNNPIGFNGVRYIRHAPWHHLQRLELKSTKLGPRGAKEIVKSEFKELLHLRIGFNELCDSGVRHLALGQWRFLQEMWLQGNHIGIEGCIALTRANWKKLVLLSLWDNKIDGQCCKNMLKLPSCDLVRLDLTFCNTKGCQNNWIEKFLKLKFPSLTITQ